MKNKQQIAIGIDCGTSGLRAIAIDTHHNLLAQAETPIVHQSPEHWWSSCCNSMDSLLLMLTKRLDIQQCTVAISVDATSSSVLLTSPTGVPITPVLMYYDACPEQAATIRHDLSPNSGAHGQQSSLAKVLALVDQLPEQTEWRVCHQADWLLMQLSGVVGISDENNCLKLGYDPVGRQWETATTQWLPWNTLPRVLPPATPIGHIKPELAQRWHLPHNTVIATGTTDSIAAFLATKAHRLGDAVISLGSTLAFKLVCQHPFFDATTGIYSHRLWDKWLVGGASNAGGACLLDYFSMDEIIQLSPQLIHRPRSLFSFYPLPKNQQYERFPVQSGIRQPTDLPSDRLTLLQTIIEGLVAVESLGWQQLENATGQSVIRLFSTGGGNKNPAWAGLRKQSFTYTSEIAFSEEAALGSALIALKSLTNHTLV